MKKMLMPAQFLMALLMVLALLGGDCFAEKHDPGRGKKGSNDPKRKGNGIFLTDVPNHPGSAILGRPTATSVALSLLWQTPVEAVLVWVTEPDRLPTSGRKITLAAGEPQLVVLNGLAPNSRYRYALLEASTRKRLLPVEQDGSFQTARLPGSDFTFTIQADPHLDDSSSPELYRQTLANVLSDSPDFHIDLGDTFMTEKHTSRESAARQYVAQRYYFGQTAHSVPLFLALGNHDGESLDRSGKTTADSLAVWSHGMRSRYFANPVPDSFYSGNLERHLLVGQLQNYYSWQWGDALFVVLDPYWTSLPSRGGQSPWNMTIGKAQYDWLTTVLKKSSARFKFIFIHQLTGSYHAAGRGGAEAAFYQEWGGHEIDGRDTFTDNRPNWKMPIHKLFVETGVTAVFHGHDHFYARQELDGIIYQLVPQPAHRNDRFHQGDEYGYKQGKFLPNSGYLRVKVSPAQVTVEYVRSALPENEHKGISNGSVAHTYTLLPWGKTGLPQ